MKGGLLVICVVLVLVSAGCITRSTEIEIANWPNGYRSAVCTTFDMERASQNDLKTLTSILRSKEINATFFVVTGYYQDTPEVLNILKDFEVASMAWNQSEWMLSDLNFKYQDFWIKQSDKWLEEHDFKPRGFRAPYLRYNSDTLKILEDSGYVYDSSMIGTMPQINGIIEVPMAINYDPFWSKETMEYSTTPTYLIFKRTHEKGELFSFHTHPEKTMENLPQFIEFLDYINEKNVWPASCIEVADWWRNKQTLEITGNSQEATVKNTGNTVITGVTLKITPKREVEGAITIVEEENTIYAVLPDLSPGAETTLRII